MSFDKLVLVQLSDTHFSDDPNSTGLNEPRGQEGHDVSLVTALANALDNVWARHNITDPLQRHVVLTGDLSRFGIVAEFRTAMNILLGYIPVPGLPQIAGIQSVLGLGLVDIFMIPGNHDHWAGRPSAWLNYGAHNPAIFGVQPDPDAPFVQTPWNGTIPSQHGHFELRLYGVDSNSGHAGKERNYSSGGRISRDELARLSVMMSSEKPDRKRIRAILCHHSLGRDIWEPAGPLDAQSVRTLLSISARHGVAAILTGHTHRMFQKARKARSGKTPREVWERRAASALQGPAEPGCNGFLVHILTLEDSATDRVQWNTDEYRWTMSGFARVAGDTPTTAFY
jgi:3',5'-cyclic AMP phosphodiesterase CpdA